MKKLLISLLVFGIGVTMVAQSDFQFTHFMYNKLSYNPAYTGSKGALDLSGFYRKQWDGIDGAPATMNLNAHTPFAGGRNALGLSFAADQIGKVNTTAIDLFYAYHIPISGTSKLSFGLQGRIEQSKLKWSKADPVDLIDSSIPNVDESSYAPNFGVGAYYYAENYFVGLSVPRLLKNSLFLNRADNTVQRASTLTYYITAGTIVGLSRHVELLPSILVTYNPNAPVDLDFNANLLFLESFWLGASYRLADSFDVLAGYQFTNGMRLGLAMDFTTSRLNKFTNGSYELMLGYTFKCKDCNVQHLRFF